MRRTDGAPRPRRTRARSLSVVLLPVAVVILAVVLAIQFDVPGRLRGDVAPPAPTPTQTRQTGTPFFATNPTPAPSRTILATARPTNTPYATVALGQPTAAAETPTAAAATTLPTATPTPESTPTPLPATTIGDSGANLRAAPDGEVLATLPPGTPILLLGISDDGTWWQVREPEAGLEGWMHVSVVVVPEDVALALTATPTTTPTVAAPDVTETPIAGPLVTVPAGTPAADATPGGTPTAATPEATVDTTETPAAEATAEGAETPLAEPTALAVTPQVPQGEYLTRHFAISFPAPVQRVESIVSDTGERAAQGVYLIVPIRWRNTDAAPMDTYVNGPTLCIVDPVTPVICLDEDVLARSDYFHAQGKTWFDWMAEPEQSVDGWLVFDVPDSLTAPVLRVYFDARWDAVVAEVLLQ